MGLVHKLCALGPRPSGTDAARKTAEFIAGAARSRGYTPMIDTWEESTVAGAVTFRNVTAILAGKRAGFVIIGSHYDTKYLADAPSFVGANDSASSTALLLELMQVLRDAGAWNGPELRFLFFDGEEARVAYAHNDGFHGSRHAAATLRRCGEVAACRAMILLDMIGDRDLSVTLARNNDRDLVRRLLAIAERQGSRHHFAVLPVATILDDHVAFANLGIPALDIIDFRYGDDNCFWHTAQDTPDKLSAESLETVGNAVLQLLSEL